MTQPPNVSIVIIIPTAMPESRWVHEVPKPGSTIEDRWGRKWRVAEALQSGRNLHTVHCEPIPRGDVRTLAGDLLERARKAVSPQERRRRNYIP